MRSGQTESFTYYTCKYTAKRAEEVERVANKSLTLAFLRVRVSTAIYVKKSQAAFIYKRVTQVQKLRKK